VQGEEQCRDGLVSQPRQLPPWRSPSPLTSEAVPIRPERLCHELTRHVPDDAIIVVDTGHAGMWMGGMFDLTSTRQSYMRSAGHLGWAFPAGLGAKCACPDRPVVTFTGDAGFWYHIAEVETAARWNINAVTVVNNNSGGNQSKRGFDRVYAIGKTEGAVAMAIVNRELGRILAKSPALEIVFRPDEVQPEPFVAADARYAEVRSHIDRRPLGSDVFVRHPCGDPNFERPQTQHHGFRGARLDRQAPRTDGQGQPLRTSACALASLVLAVTGAFTLVGTVAAVVLGLVAVVQVLHRREARTSEGRLKLKQIRNSPLRKRGGTIFGACRRVFLASKVLGPHEEAHYFGLARMGGLTAHPAAFAYSDR